MNKKIELLAPAGDWEAFLAAVENGADAVYLGGQLFNARQLASNFDAGQLKKALEYAHVRGVQVYLTINTLLGDRELEQGADFAAEAYSMGIDGIIVQDMGFAGLLRKLLPGLELHASTQMTVYNLEGVQLLEKLGFKRAVLARELSIDEITYISSNTPLEIEIFVHGALCISYSGQCLMSSIIGGRSGNRGRCAQPCRLPYEIGAQGGGGSKRGYLLSPKDICSIGILENLIDSGAKSLKIEGRMKSPEYVATTVRIYRKYLDMISDVGNKHGCKPDAQDTKELEQIFNRGGFSKGYLVGECGKDIMCFDKPKNRGVYLGEVHSFDRVSKTLKIRLEDRLAIGDGIEVWNGEDESPGTIVTEIKVDGGNKSNAGVGEIAAVGSINGEILKGNRVYKTSDKSLNAAARETFSGRGLRKSSIEGKITVKSGMPAALTITDGMENHVNTEGGIIPECAVNKPLTVERLKEQLSKTGATPFEFAKIDIELDENLSVPVSEINNLRRRALEMLEKKKADRYLRVIPDDYMENKKDLLHFPGNSRKKEGFLKVSAYFYNLDTKFDLNSIKVDRVYLPLNIFLDERNRQRVRACREKGCEVFAALPSVTKGNYDKLIKLRLEGIIEWGIDGLLIGNIGSLKCTGGAEALKIMGDYQLNVFNSFSIEELSALGLSGVTLSPELTLEQIGRLRELKGMTKEALVYGRIAVMTSEYCPAGSTAGGFGAGNACNEACRKGSYKLKDRIGMEFPVLCDRIDCRSIILNSNVLFVLDSLDRIKTSGVDMVRLNITDEQPGEISEITDMYRAVAENGIEVIGRFNGLIERIKSRGFTKGHYFRGV